MDKDEKILGFRHIENVPAGVPYFVAWFDKDNSMNWNYKNVNPYQLAYLGARLSIEAVRNGGGDDLL